jgi:cation diffusion facilitator family transporter
MGAVTRPYLLKHLLNTHMETTKKVAAIKRITLIGFGVNAVLMLMKIVFGLLGHSDALVADGVHSFSDFATDLIVLIFVGIAYKNADDDHPYGHGKYETFSTLLIAVALLLVAMGIGLQGAYSIFDAMHGVALPRPGMLTIIVAAVSIFAKEMLYHATVRVAHRVNSPALVANAWHHRSDAISSIATLIGVSAAYFLGDSWHICDPIASILISVFIAISAIGLATPSISELLERALPKEQVEQIGQIIAGVPGVVRYHHLRTRRNGHSCIIDVHVKVDPNLTVTVGHEIATAVEQALRENFTPDLTTSIHIEPA